MKNRCLLILSAAVLLSSYTARAQKQPDMGQLMQAMGAMLGGGTNAATAAVADFRELKALLPADLPGMKRTNASGEKNSVMGMTIAEAEGQYQAAEGEGHITIKISDMGGTGAIAGMMQYGWASMEVDKESDTGYERSTTIAGNKAMEKFDTANKSGSTQILVNKHFTVEVSGYGITPEQLTAAVGKVDLAKLATIQPKPAAAPAQ